MGDPYLPFVELLLLLAGDVEARRATGTLSPDHARRLRELAPAALQAVLQIGPTLIDALVPGAALLERARALPHGMAWVARVQEALEHRVAAPSQAFLFDQASRVLQALAWGHPLIAILDDLQWADAASISLLFHIGRRLAGHRMLILGAYRPEEVAAGREGQAHPLQAVLLEFGGLWEENEVDLAQAEGRAFVEALVDSEPNRLEAGFRDELHRHTGGHALFTVELLRGLEQRGDLLRGADGRWMEGPALDWDHLPKRVEAVIAAHIARLPREQQELLAVASVEGEEFHAEVAARVLQRKEGEVLADLSGSLSQEHRLLAAQSLRRVGEQRFSRYRFRHQLFQHYLYGRLDPVRRAHLHGEVANALEALGAAGPDRQNWTSTTITTIADPSDLPEVLGAVVSEATMAWHWEEAGLAEKAMPYHGHAARRMVWMSFAFEEALPHSRTALRLWETLPDSLWKARWGLMLYGDLGTVLAGIKGMVAPEVGQAWRNSLECAERTGDGLLVADALMTLAIYHRNRGELDSAISLQEQSLAQGGPPGWAASMQGGLAQTLLHRGDFITSGRLWQPLADGLLQRGPAISLDAGDVGGHVPWTLWCLGYPDQALRASRTVLEIIYRQKSKLQVGTGTWVLAEMICFIHQLRREVEGVKKGLQSLLPTVEENRCYPFLQPYATLYLGWVQVQRGNPEQGIETLRRGVDEWSRQLVVMRPYWKAYLAEALGRVGRVDEGLQVLAEALDQLERTNERFNEAELWRLRGELLLQQRPAAASSRRAPSDEGSAPVAAASCRASSDEGGAPVAAVSYRAPSEEAERCFRRAIAVAQSQQAKSWELRAATSLARLLRDQRRVVEARDILSPVYHWFTEGFDTPDLMEAKALLDELDI
jgi:tetratricopeptide (TPR) repeat protein